LTKHFECDVKVYRAYNKNHAFFTVFGKSFEEKIHSSLGEQGELHLKGGDLTPE